MVKIWKVQFWTLISSILNINAYYTHVWCLCYAEHYRINLESEKPQN